MVKFILRVVANSFSFWVAALVLDGVNLEGNFIQILLLGVVFGLVNALIKPFLKLISTPLIVLTLGLFTLIINTLLLLFTEWLMSLLSDPPVLQIDGFLNALLASVIISLISWLLSLLIGD
jgi:putative membrane protein